MHFWKSACHSSHQEAAPQVNSAVVTCVIGNPCDAVGTAAPLILSEVFQFHVCVHVRIYVWIRVLVHVLACVHVFVNSNMSQWIFTSYMEIRLFIPDGNTRRRGSLKGLSHERGWIVFATVLISRINSWESWFIVNPCRENKHISHGPNVWALHSYNTQFKATFWTYYITFIHTWAAFLCSTSRMSPSLSRSGERLSPLPLGGFVLPPFFPQLGVSRLQFLLSISCLFQQFIHHTFKSPYK